MVRFGLKLHGVCVYELLSAVVDRLECVIGHFRHRLQHAQRLNCAHVSLLAKMPLLSASVSTAARNSHKLAYFELSIKPQ